MRAANPAPASLRLWGQSISLKNVTSKTCRALVVLVVVSSLLNGLAQTAAIQLGNTSVDDLIVALKYTAGDILGSLMVFACAGYALRRAL